MSEITLPFPSKELAERELAHDACYNKIPREDRKKIIDMAWSKGEKAAADTFARFEGSYNFLQILEKSGLKCELVDKDFILGDRRYFSDYYTGRKLIRLYTRSISLWASQNGISDMEARNMILGHEYFHYLEHSEIGLTSREYQVPMLILGTLKLGRTGIVALSEIGAHAFAWAYRRLYIGGKKDEVGEDNA